MRGWGNCRLTHDSNRTVVGTPNLKPMSRVRCDFLPSRNKIANNIASVAVIVSINHTCNRHQCHICLHAHLRLSAPTGEGVFILRWGSWPSGVFECLQGRAVKRICGCEKVTVEDRAVKTECAAPIYGMALVD